MHRRYAIYSSDTTTCNEFKYLDGIYLVMPNTDTATDSRYQFLNRELDKALERIKVLETQMATLLALGHGHIPQPYPTYPYQAPPIWSSTVHGPHLQ